MRLRNSESTFSVTERRPRSG